MKTQTELHRHLDISIRNSTLLELAQAKGFESQSTSAEAFRNKTFIREPMTDLDTVLARFEIFPKVLDRPEILERVAFETVEDCHREGTAQVELRFSPAFVTSHSKLSWETVLDAFERGIQRATRQYPDIKAGMLCIASRDFGVDEAARTVEFLIHHRSRFLGMDLAGNEVNYPCRLFEEALRPLKVLNIPVTIHAGEAVGPENIWEAIELLGARRIGHGISAIQDPQLMRHLRDKKICLEMCPTSNWLTRSVPSLEEHPLPQILRAGIPVCINTDDPGVFEVTLPSEMDLCWKRMGMSLAELERCNQHAADSAF